MNSGISLVFPLISSGGVYKPRIISRSEVLHIGLDCLEGRRPNGMYSAIHTWDGVLATTHTQLNFDTNTTAFTSANLTFKASFSHRNGPIILL